MPDPGKVNEPGNEGSDLEGRDETEDERLDRNLSELLQELRVALPGVQVLLMMFVVLWAVLPLKRRLKYRDEGLPFLGPPADG